MANKRITDQTTDTTLSAGDYIIVDSSAEGTRKFDLGTELTEIKEDLAQMYNGLSNIQKSLLITILRSALYSSDQSENIDTLETSFITNVEEIVLSASTLSFNGVDSEELTYTLSPAGATGTVTWASSNPNVAVVSNGVVTSVGNGSCIITASIGDIVASCTVSVTGITASYSMTQTLTNCTSDFNLNVIASDTEYTIHLTPTINYDLSTVTVTMGGIDITSTVYSNGVVTLSNVSGDVVITAIAVFNGILYHLTTPTVTNGTTGIDSGVMLNDEAKSFTILLDAETTNQTASNINNQFILFTRALSGTNPGLDVRGVQLILSNNLATFKIRPYVASSSTSVMTFSDMDTGGTLSGIPFKIAVTHDMTTNSATIYASINGEAMQEVTGTASAAFSVHTDTVKFGAQLTSSLLGMVYQANEIIIYDHVLNNNAIAEFITG